MTETAIRTENITRDFETVRAVAFLLNTPNALTRC